MSQTLTYQEIRDLPSRDYADPSHKSIGETESQGHHPSPDAIGGYYGIQWWSVFEDENGQRYKVWCCDGTYRSAGPYPPDPIEDDENSFEDCHKEPFNPIRFSDKN